MTVSRGAPFHLLLGGQWTHLEAVAPGVAVSMDRPSSEFRTLGNVRYMQVAERALRAWGLSFQWEDAEASRALDDAAANPSDEAWLLDVNLAQINQLASVETKGRSSVLISVDGRSMRAFEAGEGFTSLVLAGESYHLSFTTTHTAASVIGTYDIGAGPVNIVAPVGTGARRGSVSFIPPTDGEVEVSWTVADVTTAARLTLGSVDTLGWIESRGKTPCRVLVGDSAATFNMSWSDRLALADSSYVVMEVG